MRVIKLKLKRIKLKNYRCFGEEQVVDIDDITLFIGNNSTGKTAALSALNCMFSEYGSDRILTRKDFHVPPNMDLMDFNKQDLYVEAVFEFDELLDDSTEGLAYKTIPSLFEHMIVDKQDANPYMRIRMEATWEKSNSIEGIIESKIYYITCPENEEISDEDKVTASRRDLDRIRVVYIPAIRDPAKQLRNTSGTIMHRMINSINWSAGTKENIKKELLKINKQFMKEPGISQLDGAISSQWKKYDSDVRYYDAKLRFYSADLESTMKSTEVVFMPTEIGREYTVDQMGDGLRSLFYISLVNSILDVEISMLQELEDDSQHAAFQGVPPILTIVALEEPENHISPHLLGKLINNLKSIAEKSNSQTIITSHSPSIVKRIEPSKIRYFRIGEERYTFVRRITLPDKEKLADQYKFVKEAVKAYPELYFAKLVILGEGDSEEIILPRILEIMEPEIDLTSISIVPLGGRHVNHFWRLLSDLHIPYITLLDLDRERNCGGIDRIRYVLEQLEMIECDLSTMKNVEKKDDRYIISADSLDDVIKELEGYHVFFSNPLDIDFLMLEHYGEFYKRILSQKEGPVFELNDGGKKKRLFVRDYENDKIMTNEFKTRMNECVRSTLKKEGGDGKTYTLKQKKLMIWYTYFFLNRGKPTTHIEVMSEMEDNDIKKNMPAVFKKIIKLSKKCR